MLCDFGCSQFEEADELYQELRERTASISMADGVVRPTVRPLAVRPDGLEGAGMRFAEAGLASSTGPVFDADDLPEGSATTRRTVQSEVDSMCDTPAPFLHCPASTHSDLAMGAGT